MVCMLRAMDVVACSIVVEQTGGGLGGRGGRGAKVATQLRRRPQKAGSNGCSNGAGVVGYPWISHFNLFQSYWFLAGNGWEWGLLG